MSESRCPRCGKVTLDDEETHRCDLAAPPGGPVRKLKLGEVLEGRWRLERQLGHGASGTVFLASDLTKRGKVAVKVLSAEQCGNPRSVARFEREAALLASLEHPNLVALLSVGRAGGAPFIVMKYLRGVTLAEHRHASGGRLDAAAVLRIFRGLCAGLGHLHQSGLVHRDVKPGNVIVGAAGEVTLLDLGMARDPGVPALTQPGVVVGTPRYMAPEQLEGSVELDLRADLYSLAVVAFELLTGELPAGSGARPEGMPPALSALFARGLAKAPSERFGSAGELLAALEVACSGISAPEATLVDAGDGDDEEASATGIEGGGVPRQAEGSAGESGAAAELADDPGSSLSPLDTLDGPDSDGATSGKGRPGATLMLPDSEELPAGSSDDLEPGFGALRIVATQRGAPTQASVMVDGVPRGASPLVVALLPGQHLIRVERVGFGAAERCVVVGAPGEPTVVEIEVKAAAKR